MGTGSRRSGGSSRETDRRGLSARLQAFLPAIGSDRDEAIVTAFATVVVSAVVTVGYAVYFLALGTPGVRPLVAVNAVALLLHSAAFVLLMRRSQLGCAVLTLSTSLAQVLAASAIVGVDAGFSLFLIAVGQLNFMIFTDRQRAWRWLYFVTAAGTFAGSQFFAPRVGDSGVGPRAIEVLFSINAASTAAVVAILAVVAHARSRAAQAAARDAMERTEYLANTDALTGLANRRPVIDELERVSRRGVGRYSVVLADVDAFKELNDMHGHQCGDAVLAALGPEISRHVREVDTAGRWGGEEFIVVLPRTTIEEATVFAERLRRAIEGLEVAYGGRDHHVTVSVGVADGMDDAMWHRVVRRADAAMYQAKQSGKNTVRTRPLSATLLEPATMELPLARRTRRGARR